MITDTKCILVYFKNNCEFCSGVMRNDIDEDGVFFVALNELLADGCPICECGAEKRAGKAEILA
jgi:hypothetical protein